MGWSILVQKKNFLQPEQEPPTGEISKLNETKTGKVKRRGKEEVVGENIERQKEFPQDRQEWYFLRPFEVAH